MAWSGAVSMSWYALLPLKPSLLTTCRGCPAIQQWVVKLAIEIVDLPTKNGDFPLFVCFPEGKSLGPWYP